MNDTTVKTELSFWRLLKRQKVEIPIIQRDYAQGRKDEKVLREKFLNALYDAVSRRKPIKLDFIYGSMVNNAFQPLDGQQRLTTLYLLHWYAASKEAVLVDENMETMSKFSYETRASSREFCNELVNRKITIDSSLGKPSDVIINSSWFFLSWKKDPTIDAMLRAIDDIHSKFKNIDGLWDILLSDELLISFNYVELENFGLTDDLYIKMNARGKLLTPFENFKATLQNRIDENDWDCDKDALSTFACKIDTVWTDLFWGHRKEDKIDSAFIRFISTIAMILRAHEKSESRNIRLMTLQGKPDSVRADFLSKIGYQYLYKCLDLYVNAYEQNLQLDVGFPFWQHKAEDGIFSSLVYEGNISVSYTQKVLFFAQTEYLGNTDIFDRERFCDWMRVVRNIISRGDAEKTGNRPTIIRSPDTFAGVINLIGELSQGCSDIYGYLSNSDVKSSFAKEQIEEERLKAKLINRDNDLRDAIFAAEDTNFCQGKIKFILYCIDYNHEGDYLDVNKLKQVTNIVKTYLDYEISNDIRRALFTVNVNGDYKYYEYWRSWSGAVDANKWCLIDRYRELEYYVYAVKDCHIYRQYIKKLLIQLIDNNPIDICEQFTPPEGMENWKVRLIKEPNLLDTYCKSHYIAIPSDESCCYLLKGKRPRNIDSCKKVS